MRRRKHAASRSEQVEPFTGPDEVRWSTATAVDAEAALQAAEKTEKTERSERPEKAEKASGWLRRHAKDKHDEPSTPPLPLQDYTPSPATSLPPGPNPILGTGGFASSNDMTGYLVPSGSGRPSPAPTPSTTRFAPFSATTTPPGSRRPSPTPTPSNPRFAAFPVTPTRSIASPRPHPRSPLPPTPPIIGVPPRARQEGHLTHGRTPSVGTGVGGPAGSRSLASQDIRRSIDDVRPIHLHPS
jgi:hypothetical protein